MENHPESLQPVVSTPAPTSVPETVLGTYCTRCGTKCPEDRILQHLRDAYCASGWDSSVPFHPAIIYSRTYSQKEKLVGDKTQATTTPPGATVAPSMLTERSTPNLLNLRHWNRKCQSQQLCLRSSRQPLQQRNGSCQNSSLQKTCHLPHSSLHLCLPSVPRPPKIPSNKRKIILVTCIIVIILVAAVGVVVLPKMKLSGSQGTGPSTIATTTTIPVTTTTSTSSSTTPVTVPTQAPVTVPTTGVYVSANYLGGFNGSYIPWDYYEREPNFGSPGIPNRKRKRMVTATFQKADDTTNSKYPLTVGIYENGKDFLPLTPQARHMDK